MSSAATCPADHLCLHYHRADADYSGWAVYAFGDVSANVPDNFDAGPIFSAGTDFYGVIYQIKLKPEAAQIGFIVHNMNSGAKDPGPDMHLTVENVREAWMISGDATVYTSRPQAGQLLAATSSRLQAYWVDRSTVAIPQQYLHSDWNYALICSPDGRLEVGANGVLESATVGIPLSEYAPGLTGEQLSRFPQLGEYVIFHLSHDSDIAQLKQLLKGRLAVAASDTNGTLTYLTGVQQAGVIDDLFYYPGKLGVLFRKPETSVRICLWAPTAQSVRLLLYRNQLDTTPEESVAMEENNGTWSVLGDNSWREKYYLYSVSVYVPSVQQIVENLVTDPYSVDLALNGTKTRITDLNDGQTKPDGWDASRSPALHTKNDLSIYELHVREFSSNDESVTEEHRGTYLAFADPKANGMQHLAKLAEAGLKAVHLLPTFHFSSVDEDKTRWKSPGDLSLYSRDSTEQQAHVAVVQNEDGYNWGYDPVHYLAPAGAYAFDSDNRVKEYRRMVLALHRAGLRVIQDQVFNHTVSSGQAANSVLDKIVPAYYYRLDADGNVQTASCCPDTASERRMMEKLMIDAVVQNARDYKVDGFRFDLMGMHFVYNMQHISEALAQLTLDRDGVDGSKIYLYGEGWQIGETANNALGPNASQANMYGTCVGTFNDRIRDGVRGGGPFSDGRIQGFATGLFTDSNQYTNENQSSADQLAALLLQSDWIKASLAGNLRDFTFIDSHGQNVKACQVNYNGQGAGYTETPIEAINYCSVHDNQTLFDAVQLKSPVPQPGEDGRALMAMRVRRQVLAMSLVMFGQGVPLFLAGDDLLRSKDMDGNSFNSGDWFNRLDFTYRSNNWGIGLPIAKENQVSWPIMQPLLANPSLKPSPEDIAHSREAFRELLAIRESSLLFRMRTPEEVQANVHFLNDGPQQVPGLLVMMLKANNANYGTYRRILVVFNARKEAVRFADRSLQYLGLHLHPVQVASNDAVTRESSYDAQSGSVQVPGLTTAAFVS